MYYTTIDDGDGHTFVVPVDRLDEAYKILSDITAYYHIGGVVGYWKEPPEMPDWIVPVSGTIVFRDWMGIDE